MADETSPFERGRRSALSEGAARLDGLARELKTRQIAETLGMPPERPVPVSPDEMWARNFMTRGIGPRPELPHADSISPAMPMPRGSFGMSFDLTAPPASADAGLSEAPRAIGAELGKSPRRRSWLGRLLRGKSLDV